MRYLGLDVGAHHIGIAVGELLASELTTINASKNQSFYQSPQSAYDELGKLIESEQADAIVIGLPINAQNELSNEAIAIKTFGDELGKKIDKTIHYVNETLSSFMAVEMLESQGLSIDQAKRQEHQLSAQLILQQYIEENANP